MDHITTPFGRRPMTLAMVAGQVAADACPDDKAAHKWKVFRSITECRDALGVTDRALSVLNALLSCMPEVALTSGIGMTVFPSNAQLTLRTHGMTESTLRRHLATLVERGLIIRRDSPNGKRYVRRGQGGQVEKAYGFDLTPVLVRCEEFDRLATEARDARTEAAMAREQVTILRRDIGKMIGIALEHGVDAKSFSERFSRLCGRLPRIVTRKFLAPLVGQLHELAIEIGKCLSELDDSHNITGNDVQPEGQLQNSNPEPSIETDPVFREGRVERVELGLVLRACPDITMYSRQRISSWPDLITTAGTVRGALGISPSAWDDARAAMGDASAAVTIAAILQRADQIKSPGGYLRGLSSKAKEGQFSTGPMIMALLRQSPIPKSRSTSM